MKRWILFFIVLLPGIVATAQEARWVFGVSAGANYSFPAIEKTDLFENGKSKNLPGFQLGLDAEYRLNRSLHFQSGLFYVLKRAETESPYPVLGGRGSEHRQTLSFNPGYLKIPLYLTYKGQLGTDSRFYLRGGPYAAYGVSGKGRGVVKYTYNGVTETVEQWNDTDPVFEHYFHRFDWGFSFGTGVEIGRIAFGIDFDPGLKDIMKYHDPAETKSGYKNRTLSITVRYRL